MPYGSASEAQILAYGATNSDLDTICQSALKAVTSTINAHLDLSEDIDSPSQQVENCANTLAAAIISTSPEATAKSALWIIGMEMLEKLKGDDVSDAPWGVTIPVDRFAGRSNLSIVGNQS